VNETNVAELSIRRCIRHIDYCCTTLSTSGSTNETKGRWLRAVDPVQGRHGYYPAEYLLSLEGCSKVR
jgi:hypothetical protein